MNDLDPPRRDLAPVAASTPARGPVATAGRKAAQVLQAAHRMQEPWRLKDDLLGDFPDWLKAAYSSVPKLAELRHPDHADRARQAAEEILEKLPPIKRMQELFQALCRLDEARPDRNQTLALISVMIDGFPNARPHNPEAYVEGLVHEVTVAEYVPAVVAHASRSIVKTEKFPPTIAEFLKACEEADAVRAWAARVGDAMALRGGIELSLTEADRLGPRDLDEEWREELRAFRADRLSWKRPLGTEPGGRRCVVPKHILAEFGYGPEPAAGTREIEF